MYRNSTTSPSGERRDRTIRAAWIQAGATLAGAVFGGVVGIFVGNSGVLVNVLPLPGPARTVTVTAAPLVDNSHEGSPVSPSASQKTGQAASKPPTVWHQGSLAMRGDARVDLDAPTSDPQWGAVSLSQDAEYDIRWFGSARVLYFLGDTAKGGFLPADSSIPCYEAAGFSASPLQNIKDFRTGRILCVATNELRIAQLKVTQFNADDSSVAFDVTVYDKR